MRISGAALSDGLRSATASLIDGHLRDTPRLPGFSFRGESAQHLDSFVPHEQLLGLRASPDTAAVARASSGLFLQNTGRSRVEGDVEFSYPEVGFWEIIISAGCSQ
jgi:hypothetical protein